MNNNKWQSSEKYYFHSLQKSHNIDWYKYDYFRTQNWRHTHLNQRIKMNSVLCSLFPCISSELLISTPTSRNPKVHTVSFNLFIITFHTARFIFLSFPKCWLILNTLTFREVVLTDCQWLYWLQLASRTLSTEKHFWDTLLKCEGYRDFVKQDHVELWQPQLWGYIR